MSPSSADLRFATNEERRYALAYLRWLAGGLMFHQLDAVALLLSLAGLALAAGGVKLAKAAAPALLFLLFMVPLPYDVERTQAKIITACLPLKLAERLSLGK